MLIAGILTVCVPATGGAVPPPPPNPSKDEIAAKRQQAESMASRVGELTSRLATVEAELVRLSARVERKMEKANKARVDLRRAESAYQRAQRKATAAAAAADVAARRVDRQRRRLDRFAAGSYKQRRLLGSVPALMGAESPNELLERSVLLDVVSESQLDVLEELRKAQTVKANKDSMARQALQRAEDKRQAAQRARATAEAAKDAAVSARQAHRATAEQLRAEKARVREKLEQARSRVEGLQDQRERYQDWLAAKRREQRQAQAAAAQAAQQQAAAAQNSAPEPAPAPQSSAVEIVVQRALSQVGVPYAWGGGNAYGPTRGIRDGGVADAHGDYLKIGFDCSGLMVYAFAGVGIDLPHYSGYQYQSGRKVPLSQMQRGDMLFWNDGGSIHHVALYLGDGMMVEAPYSGAYVRVVPVRYDGIAPYAVRLL